MLAADVGTLTNGDDLLRFIDDAQLRIRGLSSNFYVGPHKDSVVSMDCCPHLHALGIIYTSRLLSPPKAFNLGWAWLGHPSEVPTENTTSTQLTSKWVAYMAHSLHSLHDVEGGGRGGGGHRPPHVCTARVQHLCAGRGACRCGPMRCPAQLAWDETLNSVRTILDAWIEVQNRWNHIAPLFGAQSFHEQLPAEVRRAARRRVVATYASTPSAGLMGTSQPCAYARMHSCSTHPCHASMGMRAHTIMAA